MSAHTKTHHIDNTNIIHLVVDDEHYAVPKKAIQEYRIFSEGSVSADEAFKDLNAKYTKVGALLKGLRYKEGLTQVEFAKRINVTQANLSKMENGKRPVGRKVAKRIGAAFGANYRYFLE